VTAGAGVQARHPAAKALATAGRIINMLEELPRSRHHFVEAIEEQYQSLVLLVHHALGLT
jgi:hypothetical protein